jgi:hypothetical protein
VLERLPGILAVLLMLEEELSAHDLLFKLRDGLFFSLVLDTEKWDLKFDLLGDVSHGKRRLLRVSWNLDGQHQVFHEADNPNVIESFWVSHLKVYER